MTSSGGIVLRGRAMRDALIKGYRKEKVNNSILENIYRISVEFFLFDARGEKKNRFSFNKERHEKYKSVNPFRRCCANGANRHVRAAMT
ncbi:hypothetical protein ABH945_006346 [Paraburkholderia sp. GAS333]|uniref:hypothetical protein n=1 Tax=Paraburkholderia sp. GAS333 TaxID=3156279 RepID=UPI003D24EF1F